MKTFNYQSVGLVLSALFIAAGFYFHPGTAFALESVVYVDDDFTALDAGGHIWGVDAFNTVPNGIAAVAVDGIVNVAPGTYITSAPITLTKKFNLIGPGKDAPSPAIMVSNACSRVLNIQTSGIVVRGMHIKETDAGGNLCADFPNVRITGAGGLVTTGIVFDDNELIGGQSSLSVRFDTRDATISNNRIHNSVRYGINLASQKDSEIFGNEVFDSTGGMVLQSGRQAGVAASGLDDGIFTGTTIHDNYFHDNDTGIDVDTNAQPTPFVIGPNNVSVGNNQYGINIITVGDNIIFEGNKIYNNVLAGVYTASPHSTELGKNYWGAANGPFHSATNPTGSGNGLSGDNDINNVIWRPYYVDADMTELSSVTTDAANIGSLFENGGTIYFEGPSLDTASEVEINEDLTLTMESDNGTSSIELSEGTEITEVNNNSFDATQLTATNVTVSDLAGFADEALVVGALQWGVPNVELAFSDPVTVHLFLGSNYDGRTLTVQRSTSGGGGWTTQGVVDSDSTCFVVDGTCTFHTTRASYFVAVEGTPTHSPSGDNLDEELPTNPPIDNFTSPSNSVQNSEPQSIPADLVGKVLTIPNLQYNVRGEEVKQLQTILRNLGFFPNWVKSTGWFGPITQKALKNLQTAFGLQVTGTVDQPTWYFLQTFFY